MKITIKGILEETPFTLGIWRSRLATCQGIVNNFKDEIIQDVIDFKGKRDVLDYDVDGYVDVVNKVWHKYSDGEDFNSAYWGQENMEFTSDFIMEFAKNRKEVRVTLKKKKISEMKDDIIRLEKEIKD